MFSKEEHRTPTTEFHRQVTWTAASDCKMCADGRQQVMPTGRNELPSSEGVQKTGRGRGHGCGRGLDDHRSIGHASYM